MVDDPSDGVGGPGDAVDGSCCVVHERDGHRDGPTGAMHGPSVVVAGPADAPLDCRWRVDGPRVVVDGANNDVGATTDIVDGPSLHIHVPTRQVHGPSADVHGPSAGVLGPSACARGPSAGAHGPSAGACGPSAGASGPSAGAHGPSAGACGPSASAHGLRLDRGVTAGVGRYSPVAGHGRRPPARVSSTRAPLPFPPAPLFLSSGSGA